MQKILVILSVLISGVAFGQSSNVRVQDDISPGMLFLVMFAFVVLAAMALAGLVLAAVAVGLAAALLAVGIISTSTLIALKSRRPAAGLRALFLQLGLAAGAPAGLLFAFVLARLSGSTLSAGAILSIGLSAGACAGLGIAAAFNAIWGSILRRISN